MPTRLKHPVRVADLAAALGLPWEGEDFELESVRPVASTQDGSLTFTVRPTAVEFPARVAVLSASKTKSAAWIAAEQPRLAFVKALAWLDRHVGFDRPDGEPRVDPTVEMGSCVSIGRGVVIGEGTVLEHNIRIADGVRIGRDCRIKSGSVLGEDSFGFERDTDGTPLRMMHLGGVVIGDRVEIGSLNTVSQGTLDPTVVEDDVKIDNNVYVGHNCRIKRRALVAGGTVLSGSVTIGEEVWVGCGSSVINGITIGDRAFLGLGAVVIRDVAPDAVVVGNPARPIGKTR